MSRLKYGAGEVFLKKGGGRGADTFPIQFFQGLSSIHLGITLQSHHQLQEAPDVSLAAQLPHVRFGI